MSLVHYFFWDTVKIVEQLRYLVANHQTKLTDMDCESASELLSSIPTVSISYYLYKLIFILPGR